MALPKFAIEGFHTQQKFLLFVAYWHSSHICFSSVICIGKALWNNGRVAMFVSTMTAIKVQI